MLQGTFDIFTLPELLGMLASGSKTGTLEVTRGAVSVRVHLREGLCSGVEPSGPTPDEDALADALAAACFDLLREGDGTFAFETTEPPTSDLLVTIDEALVEADRRIEEWNEVCSLVPSLEVCPQLSPEIGADSITLSSAEWALAVGLDGRATVRELVDTRQTSLLEICREIAALVERGAVRLHDGRVSGTPQRVEASEFGELASYSTPAIVPVEPYGPGVEDAAAEVADDDVADADDAPAAAPVEAGPEAGLEDEPEAGLDDEPGAGAQAQPEADGALESAGADEDDQAGDLDNKDRGALLRRVSALRES